MTFQWNLSDVIAISDEQLGNQLRNRDTKDRIE